MVRINDPRITDTVAEDFAHGFEGIEDDLIQHNIVTNRFLERTYYDLIESAKEEIIISSPYIIDLHLVKIFKKRKVRKTLLTLTDNNYQLYNIMADYLHSELTKGGTKIYHYTDFSHAKFLIIDRKVLLLGSSNFGTESFVTKQEIGIVITDPEFVAEFIERMYTKNKDHMEEHKPIISRFIPQRIITNIVFYLMLFYGKTFVKLVKPIG